MLPQDTSSSPIKARTESLPVREVLQHAQRHAPLPGHARCWRNDPLDLSGFTLRRCPLRRCPCHFATGLQDLVRVLTEYEEGAGPKADLLEDADEASDDEMEEAGSGSDGDQGGGSSASEDEEDDGTEAADFGRLVEAAAAPEVGAILSAMAVELVRLGRQCLAVFGLKAEATT